jgi:glutaconate CoA-transferase, subunit A
MNVGAREKVVGLNEAVGLIPDGASVAIGGHTMRRHPMALVRAIARAHRRGLHLLGWNNGIDMDLLIGAGCASVVETSYVGISGAGLARNYRRVAEAGELRVIEHSETTGIDMFRAGAIGIGFFPSRTPLGSSLMDHNPNLVRIEDPFTGEPHAAVRAARPDVAIIHAHTADPYGNVQLDPKHWNDNSLDPLIARSADVVIVSVEQIVSPDAVRADPLETILPRDLVTAVVELPYGAHPCCCDARYDYDLDHVANYYAASATADGFKAWLDEWVDSLESHDAYLDKLGSRTVLEMTTRRSVA